MPESELVLGDHRGILLVETGYGQIFFFSFMFGMTSVGRCAGQFDTSDALYVTKLILFFLGYR
jgi:hypothetical protein